MPIEYLVEKLCCVIKVRYRASFPSRGAVLYHRVRAHLLLYLPIPSHPSPSCTCTPPSLPIIHITSRTLGERRDDNTRTSLTLGDATTTHAPRTSALHPRTPRRKKFLTPFPYPYPYPPHPVPSPIHISPIHPRSSLFPIPAQPCIILSPSNILPPSLHARYLIISYIPHPSPPYAAPHV